MLGIVGEIGDREDEHYIWTHKKFDIGYNGDKIVDVNLTSEAKVKLEVGMVIPFSYEVFHSHVRNPYAIFMNLYMLMSFAMTGDVETNQHQVQREV